MIETINCPSCGGNHYKHGPAGIMLRNCTHCGWNFIVEPEPFHLALFETPLDPDNDLTGEQPWLDVT